MAAPSSSACEIEVTKIDLGEDNGNKRVPIASPLTLTIYFNASQALHDASWTISYVVDTARKRHVIEVGSVSGVQYEAGANVFEFAVEAFDVQGIKQKHVLRNVGLLTLALSNAGQEVVEIKLVTQVEKEGDEGVPGQLLRTVFNPLS